MSQDTHLTDPEVNVWLSWLEGKVSGMEQAIQEIHNRATHEFGESRDAMAIALRELARSLRDKQLLALRDHAAKYRQENPSQISTVLK